MVAVQKIFLLGAVYKIENLKTKTGNDMCTFTLRTWRKAGKDKPDKVNFFRCVSYSGAAEVLGKYLFDKKVVYIEGTPDLYKDKDGNERFQVIVNEFSFIGDKQEESA